jgi:ADP-heptose:LPS heptosyltransferase
MENFIRLYELLEANGVNPVISGSDPEGAIAEDVARKLGVPVRKITGDTDLRTLAAVLSLAEIVVANSTGPLHLAAAVDTKVVGLYPSRKAMSPVRWGPMGRKGKVIQPPEGVECQCPHKQCTCMALITPEQVAHEVKVMLKKK